MDAEYNVYEERGFVRYRNSTFFSIIVDCTNHMDEIHKIKLLGLKNNYSQRGYLSASDFTSMSSIFRRYKDKLLHECDEYLVEKIECAFTELELFSKKHQELILSMQKKANSGNLQIVKRPDDKSRYVPVL